MLRKAVLIEPISKALLLPAKILPPTITVLEALRLPETLSDEPIDDEALEIKPARVVNPLTVKVLSSVDAPCTLKVEEAKAAPFIHQAKEDVTVATLFVPYVEETTMSGVPPPPHPVHELTVSACKTVLPATCSVPEADKAPATCRPAPIDEEALEINPFRSVAKP